MKACLKMNEEICSIGSTSTVTIQPTPPSYDVLRKIDFSIRDQIWPTHEQLKTFNLTDFTLSEFRYRINIAFQLAGVQLVFKNGIESPLFVAEGFVKNEIMKRVNISSEIRHISMKVQNGLHYGGIRFEDKNNTIINFND